MKPKECQWVCQRAQIERDPVQIEEEGLNECNERATVATRKERRKSEVEHADMPQPKWTQSRSKKNNQRSVVSMPTCRKVYKRNQAAILYSQLLTK